MNEPEYYVTYYIVVKDPEGNLVQRFIEKKKRLTRNALRSRFKQWKKANPGLMVKCSVQGYVDPDKFFDLS